MSSTKRQSDSDSEVSPPKKLKTGKEDKPVSNVYNRIASLDNATAANKNPPVAQLQNALKSVKTPDTVDSGSCVVYWMRMEDLRSMSSFIARFNSSTPSHLVNDNRAISHASRFAKSYNIPVIALFVFSPQDYKAHDRGARRIEFTLRNLELIQKELDGLNVPLFTLSHSPRRSLPQKVLELLEEWDAKHLFSNSGSFG
jgi:deoxyribodipyrimidine photo-lyase